MRELMQETIGETLEEVVLPQFVELREEISGIKAEIGGMKGEISGIKAEVSWIKANMVTKDFLEDRLADFRISLADSADWVGRQLKRLTNTMYQGKALTADQVIAIHAK